MWEQLQHQPICKHLIRAVLDYPELEEAIAHIPSAQFQGVIQEAPQHRQKPYLSYEVPGDRPFNKELKSLTTGQLRVLHQTTVVSEQWSEQYGIGQERYEQLRCQLHYHWVKVRTQGRIAYLEDLILKLELPELYPSPPSVVNILLSRLPLKPGSRVLECAAGRGMWL